MIEVAALPFLFVILIWVLALGMIVASTALWIWMLVDCATKESSTGNDKLVWILVIVLTHWIGALIYLLVRRPERIRQAAMAGQGTPATPPPVPSAGA